MAKLLSDIQTNARHNMRQTNTPTLTSGVGLETVNRIQRNLAAALPWPEFRRTDKSLTTTATIGTAPWQTNFKFLDVVSFEIQNGDDEDKYRLIFPPEDELEWNKADHKPNAAVPDFYLRKSAVDFSPEFELRPAPKYDGKTIRITGIIEPTTLVDGTDSTVFLLEAADDALEYLLAVHWLGHNGQAAYAAENARNAGGVLRRIFGKELVPDELPSEIAR